MSETATRPRPFFDLFMDGQASAADADECVTAWHNSGDDEQRSLIEYLGMTDEEYDLWTADHRLLPLLADARRQGDDALVHLIAVYVGHMRAQADPTDRAALHGLSHWLKARGVEA